MSLKLKLVQLIQSFNSDKSKIKDILAIFDSLRQDILRTQSEFTAIKMTLETKEKKLKEYRKQSIQLKKGVYEGYKLLKLYAGADIASAFLKEYGKMQ